MKAVEGSERRVLIFAPLGNDARNAADVLGSGGFPHCVCPSLGHLVAEARLGAAALIITQECISRSGFAELLELLGSQPPWSDVPLLLIGSQEHSRGRYLLVQTLENSGNVTLLERPLTVETLNNSVRVAWRARQRQYQVRQLIEEREAAERALRAAQGDLRQHADELEQRVQDRTARLQEKVAELEAFSYSVSHDLRSPLRALQAYSHVLLDEYEPKLDDAGKNYLRRISKAAIRLDQLTQDVLAYSRIAANAISIAPISLDKLVTDIIEQYPSFQALSSCISVDRPLGDVLGHEASLTQCLSNLIGNAVKFVPPGVQPAVRLWTEQNCAFVRVLIRDNGIGIPSEYHERIFKIFERVHADKRYEGSGIGLAIVRKAAERMGGEVGVDSQLGVGSTFWIKLRKA